MKQVRAYTDSKGELDLTAFQDASATPGLEPQKARPHPPVLLGTCSSAKRISSM